MQLVQPAEIQFNENQTPVSTRFDDVYFSNQDGLAEARYVFFEGNNLWERWKVHTEPHFVIAETGFGTGLNFLAVSQLFTQFQQSYPNATLKRLYFLSFEKYPLSMEQLAIAHSHYNELTEWAKRLQQKWTMPLVAGCYRLHFDNITLDLWLGDVMDNLPQLGDYMANKIDAWFLDGFAPSKNPQMWQEELFQQMYRFTKPEGTFATFTAASSVRKGLLQAGFEVEKRKGFGQKRECLTGKKIFENAPHFIPQTPWYLPQSADLTHGTDIAIVGGGIASLFCALSLLERGAKVTLYCADEEPALNASGNKQGAFYPQLSDDDEINIRFYIHAFFYGLQRLAQARQHFSFEHDFCGVALCAYNEKSAVKIRKIFQLGLPTTLIQPQTIEQLSEKAGLPLPCGGAFIPQGAWLAPREFVQNGFAYLQSIGLEIKKLQKIARLEQQNQGWILQNEQGETFHHNIVVLANGHQLTEFTQTEHLPLYPVRGQVSQIPSSPTLQKLKTVLCYDGYITPVDRAQTSHCIGASHVRNNATRYFSETEQQENQEKIQRNLTGVDWVNEVNCRDNQARIGVRCAVRDRIPMMGNVPNFAQQVKEYHNLFNLRRRKQPIKSAVNFPNLFLIGALNSRGLTSAPILGESLASLIFNEPLPLSEEIIHTLSANRSWIRKLLKGTQITS